MKEEIIMNEELRTRLMELHQEKLEVALENKDAPLSLDLQEIGDLCEFLNVFLYEFLNAFLYD